MSVSCWFAFYFCLWSIKAKHRVVFYGVKPIQIFFVKQGYFVSSQSCLSLLPLYLISSNLKDYY